MGCCGLYLAMRFAVRPVTVNTTIRAARSLVAARTAAVASASVCTHSKSTHEHMSTGTDSDTDNDADSVMKD